MGVVIMQIFGQEESVVVSLGADGVDLGLIEVEYGNNRL
jgi:hypothetical protein